MKREAKKLLPTMKVEAEAETDLSFKECQAEIKKLSDIQTKKYGIKTIATLQNDELGEFQVFVNNYSMSNLIEKFGDDDVKWIGKLVDLKQEQDKQFDNEMIVLYPVA